MTLDSLFPSTLNHILRPIHTLTVPSRLFLVVAHHVHRDNTHYVSTFAKNP
jgi:hypothetical protein